MNLWDLHAGENIFHSLLSFLWKEGYCWNNLYIPKITQIEGWIRILTAPRLTFQPIKMTKTFYDTIFDGTEQLRTINLRPKNICLLASTL